MIVETLVASVMAALVPYFKNSAEEFAKSAGKEAFEKVKAIVSAIKTRFSGDTEFDGVFSLASAKPDAYGGLLRSLLESKLAKDPALAKELESLVSALGPTTNVLQWMDQAEGVTGAEVGTVASGTLNVEQRIRDAKDVVGAKIDKFG